MKAQILVCLLFVFAQASTLIGQAPQNRPRPVNTRSPELATDRTATFRLRAAKAQEVYVNGQWPNGRVAMTKDTNDVWSVTTGPIEPGVWEYSFQVDGLSMVDPGNREIKPMREPRTSILQVPGNPPMIHDFQNVPHGTVHQHSYFSKSLNRLRHFAVYTPAGYEKSSKKFPALYLQHGSGDNQATWVAHGKAHWILDNLIAQGKAKPMVMVMMDGHAAEQGAQNNTELFERDLLEDVLPQVENLYRVKKDANNRAIVGLSMGGGQSLTIGLNHADKFAWVGGFSASVPRAEAVSKALENSTATNKKLKLLWIACGKKDFLLQRNEEFIKVLNDSKIRHEWLLTEGDHSWPIWRIYLADIAPRLF